MKSTVKIAMRTIMAMCVLIVILFSVNIFYIFHTTIKVKNESISSVEKIETIANSLEKKDTTYTLAADGARILEEHYVWAMLLDDTGNQVWNKNIPANFPQSFTSQEIATMSRWFYQDYPVTVWTHPHGLLVVGEPIDSIAKYPLATPVRDIEQGMRNAIMVLLISLVILLFFAFLIGYYLTHALKPIVQGIEALSKQEKLSLKKKGVFADVAAQINAISQKLEVQNQTITARDHARTEWIAGVSHDIRTPLSMVIGYAASIEDQPAIDDETRKEAKIIGEQGVRIKNLVTDLNLTSKLAYGMQPMTLANENIAKLLRTITADYWNRNISERYAFDLEIAPTATAITLEIDVALFRRMLENIIQNSMTHNPEGCQIQIILTTSIDTVCITIQDTGKNMIASDIQALTNSLVVEQKNETIPTHGLGLRIASQIATTHQGTMQLQANTPTGLCCIFTFPLTSQDVA